jgi:hypothetical protein
MSRVTIRSLAALLLVPVVTACVPKIRTVPVTAADSVRAAKDSTTPRPSGPAIRKALYYGRRPYGSEAVFNPLTALVNNGWDQIRTGPNRRIGDFDLDDGVTGAWQSMIHAQRLVRQYGTRDWVRYELLPLTLKYNGGGQWVPNYQLHLFASGVTYTRLIGWYEQRGLPLPRASAATTTMALHFLNEMVENTALTGGSVDALTDLLIFDPLSIALWSSDRFQRFMGERLELTEWPGMPTVAYPGGTLENTFQTTLVRIALPRTQSWRAFTTMGGSYVGGASRRVGDSTWWSVGFGWDARTNPILDPVTGRKTVELLGNVTLFVDRAGSLLGSIVLKSGYDAAATMNLYPGVIRLGGWSPGLWGQLLRDPAGLRLGVVSPLGIGIGRNP